jgi:hypothetical protein
MPYCEAQRCECFQSAQIFYTLRKICEALALMSSIFYYGKGYMITQNKCLSPSNDTSVFSNFRWVTQYHKNIFASLIYFFKPPKIIILGYGQ